MIHLHGSSLRRLLTTIWPHLTDFQITTVTSDAHALLITLEPQSLTASCPLCSISSHHVHRRYTRTIADVPTGERQVLFHLNVRRFFCRPIACPRRIFCERLVPFAAVSARQTTTLGAALEQLGLALGGMAGARMAAA